jgi:septal ring factor EnvC (AmiA/AmiB activator)
MNDWEYEAADREINNLIKEINRLERQLIETRAERDAFKKELDRIKPSRTVASEAGAEQRELK